MDRNSKRAVSGERGEARWGGTASPDQTQGRGLLPYGSNAKSCPFCRHRAADPRPRGPVWLAIAYNRPHAHPRDPPGFPPLSRNCPLGIPIHLTGDRSIHEAVLDPSGQFSITVPKQTSFAVLATEKEDPWSRPAWFALHQAFTPIEGSRVHWSLPTARFKILCVDEAGNEVQWTERSPASDLRFLPQSFPDSTTYIAGRIKKGKTLSNVLPGCQYLVEGFIQDTTGKAWRIRAGQTFVAPAEGETKEVRVELYRE